MTFCQFVNTEIIGPTRFHSLMGEHVDIAMNAEHFNSLSNLKTTKQIVNMLPHFEELIY